MVARREIATRVRPSMVVVFLDNPQCQVLHVAPIGGRIPSFAPNQHSPLIPQWTEMTMTDDKNSRVRYTSNPYPRLPRSRPHHPARTPPEAPSNDAPKRTETRVFQPANVPPPRVDSPVLAAYEAQARRDDGRDVRGVRQFEHASRRGDVRWLSRARVLRVQRLRERVVKTRLLRVLLAVFLVIVGVLSALILCGLLLLTFLSLVQMIGTFT